MLQLTVNGCARIPRAWFGALVLALVVASPVNGKIPTFRLSGHITGWSGENPIYVALWQSEGFLKTPVKQIKIEPGAEPAFQFEVPAGRWAVSAFEDKNGNGVLDMGMFGPKEPSGFWHAFSGWHTPHFDEVAASIEGDVLNADIKLK